MEWWIIAALVAVTVMMISVYSISLRENRGLSNYVIGILLDEEVYRKQQESLIEFIRQCDAKDARELSRNVYQATQSLAMKYSMNVLFIHARLWNLKKSRIVPAPARSE